VDNIIRIGSAGALSDDLDVMDIVIGQGACTNSNIVNTFGVPGSFAPIADYTLMSRAIEAAQEHKAKFKVGNILSGDNFYSAEGQNFNDAWKRMGVLAIEMEAAGLYATAAYAGKRALCICTISDHLYKQQYLTAEERQTSFTQMMEIALDTAVKMAK